MDGTEVVGKKSSGLRFFVGGRDSTLYMLIVYVNIIITPNTKKSTKLFYLTFFFLCSTAFLNKVKLEARSSFCLI